MKVIKSIDDAQSLIGAELGVSDWLEIDQKRINDFADVTGDHQWIHVDVERAKAESPFGGPIAHGYLTVSLSNLFLPQIVEVRGVSMGVNYGTGKVRFPSPVPVGSRVRGGAELVSAEEIPGGLQTLMRITIEVDGAPKPACVIDSLSRWMA